MCFLFLVLLQIALNDNLEVSDIFMEELDHDNNLNDNNILFDEQLRNDLKSNQCLSVDFPKLALKDISWMETDFVRPPRQFPKKSYDIFHSEYLLKIY